MLPGFKRADHLGLTVTDLDQATAFFIDTFGATLVGSAHGFQADDDWMADHLAVDPRAVINHIHQVQLPDGFIIELFDYSVADQVGRYPRNSDIGGHHLALEVDDIAAATAYLRARGIEVLGEPTHNDPSWPNIDGTFNDIRWGYFQTPWGFSLELIQKP
ncbi:MAG: VOC family protein [Planctomycetota bacterium]|jgi:glyoxylase I family protein